MNDYKHLVNKNYREREQDMTAYRWETSTVRKKMAVACGFLVVAAIFLACFVGWIEEAHADYQTDMYQQQVLINQQNALRMMQQEQQMQAYQDAQRQYGTQLDSTIINRVQPINPMNGYIRGYQAGQMLGEQ
jgi:hypothetical protein